MKTTFAMLSKTALALAASASLFTAPAFAQAQNPGQSTERGEMRGSGGGTNAPAAAPHANSAPSAPSGGSGGGATGGGGGTGVSRSGGNSGGGRTGDSSTRATGNSGGGSYGGSGYTGGTSGNGGTRGIGGRDGNGRATPRDAGSGTNSGGAGAVPPYARPRDGHTPVGTAAPRGSVPPATGGGGGIYVPGGGYYPGYYDPWGYGGYYGGYGYGAGGYYGGYYDPWYGGYPTMPQASYTSSDEGSLKLKIKPREAEVYVDGYYVGIVDDFDGVFQRLHIDSGSHHIEVRAPGFDSLEFDVRISPEHTTTYTGEMKRIQ